MRCGEWTGLAVLCCAIGALPCRADDNTTGIYFSGGYEAKALHMDYHGGYAGSATTTGNTVYALDFDELMVMHGGSLTFGYAFAPMSGAAWLGQRPRIEVGGRSLRGETDMHQFKTVSGVVSVNQFSGNRGFANAAGPASYEVSAQADRSESAFGLRVATDYPVGGAVTLTPSLGVTGGRNKIDIELREFFQNSSDLRTGHVRFATTEFRSTFGLRGDVGIHENLSVFVDTTVAAVNRFTALAANDCTNDNATSFSGSCNGETSSSAIKDSDMNLSPVFGASLGTAVHYGGLEVLASLGTEFDAAVPNYKNPLGGETFRMHIQYDPQWTYNGSFKAIYRF